MCRHIFSIFFFMSFVMPNNACAEIRLPAIIGSHMVLLQKSDVNIWGWANPNENIKINVGWDTSTYNVIADPRTAKWEVKIKTPKAGGPYKIIIQGTNKIILEDVMIGEVWLCGGQSNMEISANGGIKQAQDEASKATNSMIHLFYVPKSTSDFPQEDTKGKWIVCNPGDMREFSAVGYFFGKRLQSKLQQPVGLINSNWGGTRAEVWTPAELINNNPSLKEANEMTASTKGGFPLKSGSLFNAMIYPIKNFSISGVIWYQGESNRFNYSTYPQLLKTMVFEWRRLWQNDFPFYYVQIAPFSDNGTNENYVALMREAQTKCMSLIPKSGMVVISDLVDDVNSVHPQNKLDVGIRLANYALAESYGVKGISYKSPVYQSMQIENSKIRIRFDNAEHGLISKGGKPTEFYIASDDKKFIPAIVVIEGNNIVVSNKNIKNPVAVRFGFSDAATPNLFNLEGLPVNLFRTDDWAVPKLPTVEKRNNPIVGAIRWDGWVGSLNRAGLEVEHTLSPHQYHFRAPFYSKEISYDSIQCRGTTQKIMDQEIGYASSAGLNYWAFCWNPQNKGLDTSLKLYLKSAHKNDIKWCVIFTSHLFDNNTDSAWLIKMFEGNNYQKVLKGRPLVYVFPSKDIRLNELVELRNLSKEAGIPDPYVVVMGFSANSAISIADSLHADAMSCYASAYNFDTGDPYNGAPYFPSIPKSDEAGWEKYSASGKQLVPWVTTGWNPKPRIERSVLWNSYYKSNGWAKDGTPVEIAQNLKNALTWTKDHINATKANTILIYAWNEFDEGGWICPTFHKNTNRLDAIRKVLQNEGQSTLK